MKENTIIALLILCLLGIGYLIWWQRIAYPASVKECFEIATMLEQNRHDTNPSMGVGITQFDIAQYIKNMDSCLANS